MSTFKTILTACAAAVALLAANVHAQEDKPGEARAAPSKPSTKQEKQEAKAKRRATGKEMGKKDEGRADASPAPAGPKTKATAEQKAAGKSQRKAEGAAATKAPKDQTTGAGGTN